MITLTLTDQAASLLKDALELQAKAIAGAKLYTGTAAIKEFNLTRATLPHIPPTYLPGRSKPLYSATSIVNYLKSRER